MELDGAISEMTSAASFPKVIDFWKLLVFFLWISYSLMEKFKV